MVWCWVLVCLTCLLICFGDVCVVLRVLCSLFVCLFCNGGVDVVILSFRNFVWVVLIVLGLFWYTLFGRVLLVWYCVSVFVFACGGRFSFAGNAERGLFWYFMYVLVVGDLIVAFGLRWFCFDCLFDCWCWFALRLCWFCADCLL